MKWTLIIKDGTDPKKLFDLINQNKEEIVSNNFVKPISFGKDTVVVESDLKVQILINSIASVLDIEVEV